MISKILKVSLFLNLFLVLSLFAQAGKQIPDFSVRDLKGKMIVSKNLYENAPMIVFFWETCACCSMKKEQVDFLNQAHAKYKDVGLNIIGFALDGKKKTAQVKKAIKSKNMQYISIIDDNHEVKNKFKPTAIPASYIIAKGGQILSAFNGFRPGDEAKMSKILDLIMKQQ